MKNHICKFLATLTLLAVAASPAFAHDLSKLSRNQSGLKSDLERASYSIGMSLGQDFSDRGMEINPDIVARGMADVLSGGETELTRDEAVAALQKLQALAVAQQQEVLAKMAEKNKAEGEAFLSENGRRDAVKTTASGLQYEILIPGTGKTPKATDQVSVDYRGTFIDGTEFDSSYERGEPLNFSVEGIIPGWTEALQMMKVGAKWKLYVPSDLAYGPNGAPPLIEPNTTLIFEVELKDIL